MPTLEEVRKAAKAASDHIDKYWPQWKKSFV
jgi:hypothetical protein